MTGHLQIERLRCEHRAGTVVIDVAQPRFSWQVSSPRNGAEQRSYQIRVSTDARQLDSSPDLWDSGRIESSACSLVAYEGKSLSSRTRAYWSVTAWDELGNETSATGAPFELGLLRPGDWQAHWITPDPRPLNAETGSVSYLATTFEIPEAGPDSPRLQIHATALGLYELHVNGTRVGNRWLTPGWTDYDRRLHYDTYEINELVHSGTNTLIAVLAEGWYAGWLGFVGGREYHGDTPQILVQIEMDGTVVATSDDSWKVIDGPVRTSDFLKGEHQDLTHRLDSMCVLGATRRSAGPTGQLLPSPCEPVRVTDQITPVGIQRLGPQRHLIDFGQNLVGRVRIRANGVENTQVTVRHAEMLDATGALYTANLRSATSTDTYVLDGQTRWLEPAFTFHGFRYAEIDGCDQLAPGDVAAVVLRSDLETTSTWLSSHPGLNQLHSNIVWGAKGNFLEVPTDCPQRDERLGWTGDAQVFAPTANYILDTAAFFTKWARDLVDAQSDEGGFPDVAPRVVDPYDGAAGWADAGVLVPWAAFTKNGDKRVLAEHFPAMQRWVHYVHEVNPNLLWLQRRNQDVGDWLHLDAPTDKDLIATAFFAHSTRTTARAAAALGLQREQAELDQLADGIVQAFRAAFVVDGGRLKDETQTAYALALRFGLIPESDRAGAVDNLVACIDARGGRLSTGFLGVAHLLPALSDGGRADIAYDLLLAEDYPSWLYAVNAGATTIWERWDGWTVDRGFQDPEMNSFNHYAFGAVGEWMYRTAAGIDWTAAAATSDGVQQVTFAPCPTVRLEHIRARVETPAGPAECGWRWSERTLHVDIEAPLSSRCHVYLPIKPSAPHQSRILELESGRHRFQIPADQVGWAAPPEGQLS